MKKILFAGILLALLSFALIAKTGRIITGTVKDENNNKVAFATIKIKEKNKSVAANASGSFTITIDDQTKSLEISAVGYEKEEVQITTANHYDVILKKTSSALNEVVVIGYGAVDQDAVANAYSPQLQAKVAGVSVSRNKSVQYASPQIVKDEEDKNSEDDSWRYNNDFNTEGYDHIVENPFLKTNDKPLSTFSIDVDAASYANVRRFINEGELPPAGAVRIEELINYFSYNYPQPQNSDPFSINTEISTCPWNPNHKLVLIGLQGKKISTENLPASNLVFLIDVSGSMDEPDKLPLVKSSLKLLVDQLRPQDKVALVVYAGNAGLVLPSTSGDDKIKIKDAIDALDAGGSTAGGEGIKLAYNTAKKNFIKGGNNRVILCTDGDFNVGTSSEDALQTLIENERQSGVFLSVLGFGTGNYQDSKMQ
ncbi:MAG: von Willebrand factor type A domain-containing protein, partial [Parafilimonas sp.]